MTSIIIISVVIFVAYFIFKLTASGGGLLLVPTISGPGRYRFKVVGESHYQQNLMKICGARTESGIDFNTMAQLILESSNPHDNQAVMVLINSLHVGYLDRSAARSFRAAIVRAGYGSHTKFQCNAVIKGGWDRGGNDAGMYGVRLDLPE